MRALPAISSLHRAAQSKEQGKHSSAMVNYDKWDKLDISDDEDDKPRRANVTRLEGPSKVTFGGGRGDNVDVEIDAQDPTAKASSGGGGGGGGGGNKGKAAEGATVKGGVTITPMDDDDDTAAAPPSHSQKHQQKMEQSKPKFGTDYSKFDAMAADMSVGVDTPSYHATFRRWCCCCCCRESNPRRCCCCVVAVAGT